ncbi:phage tail terminator family protein [Clostridium frigidicarnis]|uniref:Phage protein n=1 Tax=Clostridium frigidicarnis TaxID=84698 RepID=A0A1I0V2B1_9CLOT|nr:hypothetical protein [Clostridium frigidicarnis]SFA70167.1 hypothetical protein SAMN04488528_100191 [Clostridium frigidicarnis]
MITLKDINIALTKKVTDGLKDTEYKDVVFTSTDITEKIQRPCFYIDLGVTNSTKQKFGMKERELQIYLYYFCKDTKAKKKDLLIMQDYLDNILLGDFWVTETFLYGIENIEHELRHADGYLITQFTLFSNEEIEIVDNYKTMENLELEINIKN